MFVVYEVIDQWECWPRIFVWLIGGLPNMTIVDVINVLYVLLRRVSIM